MERLGRDTAEAKANARKYMELYAKEKSDNELAKRSYVYVIKRFVFQRKITSWG